jgi:hypothetical protein
MMVNSRRGESELFDRIIAISFGNLNSSAGIFAQRTVFETTSIMAYEIPQPTVAGKCFVRLDCEFD